MAGALVNVGTGSTITFDTGFFAQVTSINWSGMERGAVDTTYMGTTTARTHMATDLFDAGTLEVEMHFNPDTRPPIDDAAASCVLTFPIVGVEDPADWTATAFMTNFEVGVPLEDKMTATGTLKFTGDFTIDPAGP